MTGLTLTDMLDDAAVLSFEHQLYLADLLGNHSWNVDLDAPRLAFTGDHPMVCTAVHLLGSAAPGPRSWLWSWANPSGYSPGVTGLAAGLANFGQQHGIGELTTAEVPFAALPGTPEQPYQVASIMMDAAKVFSGRWFSYNGDAGGGTRAAFLFEHPDVVLPPPEPARVMRVVQQSISELNLYDHRRALHSYATRRPLDATFTSDYSQLTMTGPKIRIVVTFDRFGRASSINGSMG